MQNILARKNLATLAHFACSSVLLGFDYDGTLAPQALSPARARMRAATRRLLARVAQCYPCVVISGRTHDDLAKRLDRLPLWHVFGNHGLEAWAQSADSARQVHEWVRHLRSCLITHPGLVVEDKTYSVTVHYRHVRDKARARQAIANAVRALANVRPLGGDQAVNLILRDGPDKGVALQKARRSLGCDTAIYVGDDDTDEDAFASAPPHHLLAIRVGPAKALAGSLPPQDTGRYRQPSQDPAHAPRTSTSGGQTPWALLVTAARKPGSAPDPLWYKDAIIYELHVKTFFDANGDGVGDFTGLIAKLDYLVHLGVTCLWLLPFYESPLRDDGYDIAH